MTHFIFIFAKKYEMSESFDIKNWFKNRKELLVISGPCSVESREQLLETAAGLSEIDKVKVLRGGIWKPRTRPDAFEGIGEVGLRWMQEAKERYGFLTMTEVAVPEHVELALRYGIDILWLGARTVANPFSTSIMAFVFAVISILLILGLCRLRSFSPNIVVLAGIAIGSVWTAATTILQFYATDVGLSAAVIWTFGDLGRATYRTDLIMLIVVGAGIIAFLLLSRRYDALLSGDAVAISVGVNVRVLRFVSLLLSSMITAVCVSFLGVIGFVGIICPHVVKKLLGQEHFWSISATALTGSLLLLFADTLSRSMGNGSALPVGAITSMLGAPFFIAIIFRKGGRSDA